MVEHVLDVSVSVKNLIGKNIRQGHKQQQGQQPQQQQHQLYHQKARTITTTGKANQQHHRRNWDNLKQRKPVKNQGIDPLAKIIIKRQSKL